jgi:hypothetical protein
VDNVAFWPRGDEIVTIGPERFANRWRPCDTGTALAAEAHIPNWMVKPWLELVWHVLGNEGGRFVVRVLDWLAMIVAEPGVKPGWHLIVGGGQGIGKDLLISPIRSAVGEDNVGIVNANGLHQPYNPWAEKRLILVAELKQTTMGSATGRDQYALLKALTENTSPTIPINQKYVQTYHARNVGAYYVTSNEVDALALDPDDRRFVVAASPVTKWSRARYARLVDWLGGPSGHGTETVAAWLRQRWATMPAARRRMLTGNAFDSQSKRDMVDAADPVRGWMKMQIEEGTWPDLMTSGDIDGWFNRSKAFRYQISPHRWGAALKALGGAKVFGGEPVILHDGRRTRVWAVKDPDRFRGMGGPQIAQAYRSATATHAFSSNASVVVFPAPDHT